MPRMNGPNSRRRSRNTSKNEPSTGALTGRSTGCALATSTITDYFITLRAVQAATPWRRISLEMRFQVSSIVFKNSELYLKLICATNIRKDGVTSDETNFLCVHSFAHNLP